MVWGPIPTGLALRKWHSLSQNGGSGRRKLWRIFENWVLGPFSRLPPGRRAPALHPLPSSPFFPYLFRRPKGAPGGKDEEKGRRGEGVKSRVMVGAQNSALLGLCHCMLTYFPESVYNHCMPTPAAQTGLEGMRWQTGFERAGRRNR